MSELSWAELVSRVHERAKFLCEYCQTAQRITGQAMHVDHINPDGGDILDNLCLSCANCNMSKARAITGLDPETKALVLLFNPRSQIWAENFEWTLNATVLRGLTPAARATINRLQINRERIVEARSNWVSYGLHPPK